MTCRCPMLNVMSGDVARDYARTHLQPGRVDGMGRQVLRCPDADVEWVQEQRRDGYQEQALVLRRLTR